MITCKAWQRSSTVLLHQSPCAGKKRDSWPGSICISYTYEYDLGSHSLTRVCTTSASIRPRLSCPVRAGTRRTSLCSTGTVRAVGKVYVDVSLHFSNNISPGPGRAKTDSPCPSSVSYCTVRLVTACIGDELVGLVFERSDCRRRICKPLAIEFKRLIRISLTQLLTVDA
jgi:hypothetical protein